MTAVPVGIAVHKIMALPGMTPRLLRTEPGRESMTVYARDGYEDIGLGDVSTVAFLDVIEQSGLRGRGGAAFPLATKARAVRTLGEYRSTQPVVVANGEEGEPASVKDRWLLYNRPHLVLDGLRLAAVAVGASDAYIYLSDPLAARSVTEALAEASLGGLRVGVVCVEPAYVAGEESAAVRAINGGPAKPTEKPPRPFELGVADRPTLVSNVETLANLPFLRRHRSASFRELGTADSPGTFLATITGAGLPPGLYELPHGIELGQVLALHGLGESSVQGVLMGGYFSGLINDRVLDMTLDHESARGLGSGLGCGAFCVLDHEDCPVAVAASVMAYFARENAGQCGSCFNGTAAMSAALDALRDGVAAQADLERLQRWSQTLRGRGACATLDGAANLARTLMREFPAQVARHLRRGCDRCAVAPYRAERPFAVEAASVT